jgi:hypothetical protein
LGEKKIVKENSQSAGEECKICQHVYAVYLDDSVSPSVNAPLANNTTAALPRADYFLLVPNAVSNKSPPAFS